MQDTHLSKLDVLGLISLVQFLKDGVLDVGAKPIHTSGNRVVSSFLIMSAVLGIRFMVRSRLSLSNSFNVIFFSPH